MWKPSLTLEFRDRTVTASDLTGISITATTVSFVGCRSKEWMEIGQRLSTLSQIETLSIERCDSEDGICASICNSKSLTSVRVGKWCVTQRNAVYPT
jgi:hypothetical protein